MLLANGWGSVPSVSRSVASLRSFPTSRVAGARLRPRVEFGQRSGRGQSALVGYSLAGSGRRAISSARGSDAFFGAPVVAVGDLAG